jgi:hypothetical protein
MAVQRNQAMPEAKKKLAFPRRQWQINPSVRVKASAKVDARAKARRA